MTPAPGPAPRFPRAAVVVLLVFFALTLVIALAYPFPSNYDELEHFSVVIAQYRHAALFPDYSRYLVVDPHDATRWSTTRNYINHPSLYYLLLAPWVRLTTNPVFFRLLNVAMATASVAIVMLAGRRFFATAPGPGIFALFAASFPKAAIVGGMINNDNLAALAGALVFAGLAGAPGATWWLALGLVLAGWSKLTALVALGVAVAVHRVWLVRSGEARLASRDTAALTVAVAAGALPYLVWLARTGHLLYRNDAHFFVPVGERPVLDFARFLLRFLAELAGKWPAAEGGSWLIVAAAGLLAPLALAGWGMRGRAEIARIGAAYGVALVALLAIHVAFSWDAYRTIGDLSNAQPRYYNVLWPGVALAGSAAIDALARRSGWAAAAAILLVAMPTALGGIVLKLV